MLINPLIFPICLARGIRNLVFSNFGCKGKSGSGFDRCLIYSIHSTTYLLLAVFLRKCPGIIHNLLCVS